MAQNRQKLNAPINIFFNINNMRIVTNLLKSSIILIISIIIYLNFVRNAKHEETMIRIILSKKTDIFNYISQNMSEAHYMKEKQRISANYDLVHWLIKNANKTDRIGIINASVLASNSQRPWLTYQLKTLPPHKGYTSYEDLVKEIESLNYILATETLDINSIKNNYRFKIAYHSNSGVIFRVEKGSNYN